MIRGKYLRERKAIRVKRRIKLLLSVLIVVLLYRIFTNSFSLYESEASSTADIDVAFFVLDDTYEQKDITLEDMAPGDTREFMFSIANYYMNESDEEVVSETDMEYVLKIRTTTNLPLEYELTRSQVGTKDMEINAVKDQNGTYFNNILEDSGTFSCLQGYMNLYTLKVTFPPECDNFEYQNIIDAIEISIEANQII